MGFSETKRKVVARAHLQKTRRQLNAKYRRWIKNIAFCCCYCWMVHLIQRKINDEERINIFSSFSFNKSWRIICLQHKIYKIESWQRSNQPATINVKPCRVRFFFRVKNKGTEYYNFRLKYLFTFDIEASLKLNHTLKSTEWFKIWLFYGAKNNIGIENKDWKRYFFCLFHW